jgi:primosomal protein N' (replication factor Y)
MRFSAEFGRLLAPPPEGIRVLGPAEAPVPRLKAEYRYQLLLKASKRTLLRSTLKNLQEYAAREKWPATAVVIDVDPLSLM